MRPRTTLLLVALMFGAAYALRGYLLWAQRLPSVHDDLAQASSLRIGYWVDGQQKTLEVDDPGRVRELMDAFEVIRTERRSYYYATQYACSVGFRFDDGAEVTTFFINDTQLTRQGWGLVTIRAGFADRVRKALAAREGRPFDNLANQISTDAKK
jgi:hypothetical protein